MFRIIVWLWVIFIPCCCASSGVAQEGDRYWIMSGAQYGGLRDSGTVGNCFDEGTGFISEVGFVAPSGWSFVFYGTSAYWTKNRVHDDKADVRFYSPYYTEVRRFFGSGVFSPFLGVGFSWSRMHFEGTKGADNQYLLLLCGGAQVRLGQRLILQGMIKPYRVLGNTLGQSWGIETSAGIGITWIK